MGFESLFWWLYQRILKKIDRFVVVDCRRCLICICYLEDLEVLEVFVPVGSWDLKFVVF